jgi:2-polyprenyl-6-methoxyphenol hydroxylase-like FAD-dependent oxidoreductase
VAVGSSLDIAIVGAGPAGLAAALYLDRAGHRVTLFERFEQPAPLGSGLILQPTGMSVLADLGLLSAALALGSRIDRLHGADAQSGRTVLDVRYAAQRMGRFGLAMHRAALFDVLYKATLAEKIAIRTGAVVEDADASADTIRLLGPGGKPLGSFDLVVDASGSRSKLRRRAKTPCEPRPLAYGAYWASLQWRPGFDPNALLQRYRRASVMIGVLPIGRVSPGGPDMAAFFWSLKPADEPNVRAAGIEAWKERVAALWPASAAMTEQIGGFDEMTLARYGHHTLAVPAGRRLAIIGDAAHSTSPQLGQGANMALLDAAALSCALAQATDVDAALAAYVRMRRWHVRIFQALSAMFTPFYQSDSALLPFVRDRLVALLARVPPGPQLLAAMVAGTLVDPFGPIGITEAHWPSPAPA